MTRADIEARLLRAGIAEAKAEAMRIFCFVSGRTPALALAMPETRCAREAAEAILCRRELGEPLAYILGVAYFCGEEYEVTPDVLIPRADTEVLIDEALCRLPEGGRIADLCCGSGCIAVSLLAARPQAVADAYDVSGKAIALAKKNAKRNGVSRRVSFYECDLLRTHGVADREKFPHAPYDLILSNPPYLTALEMQNLDPSVLFEPKLALDGGADGLVFYRHFLDAFTPLLAPRGAFVFEIGWQQGNALRALGEEKGFTVTVARDLAGRERVAVLTKE